MIVRAYPNFQYHHPLYGGGGGYGTRGMQECKALSRAYKLGFRAEIGTLPPPNIRLEPHPAEYQELFFRLHIPWITWAMQAIVSVCYLQVLGQISHSDTFSGVSVGVAAWPRPRHSDHLWLVDPDPTGLLLNPFWQASCARLAQFHAHGTCVQQVPRTSS